jgi:hypothetical protein
MEIAVRGKSGRHRPVSFGAEWWVEGGGVRPSSLPLLTRRTTDLEIDIGHDISENDDAPRSTSIAGHRVSGLERSAAVLRLDLLA